jgi:aspartyl-tRNA(Asn)/glutamyl-tRNA(Gln) amidotransferase subunit A
MAGEAYAPLEPMPLANLRVGIAQGPLLENLDATVGKSFPRSIDRLEKAGCRLSNETLPLFDDMARVNAKGGVQPAEAFAIHRDLLGRRADDIDQNVRARLERARNISAADFIAMVRERAELIRAMDARLADVDVMCWPTTPIVAPTMAEVAAPDDFARKNAMALRNTVIVNFFNLCAISLPLPREGGLPTGLMLVVRNGHDRRLFRIAAAVEKLLRG